LNAPTRRKISSKSGLQFLKACIEDVLHLAMLNQLRKKRNTGIGVVVTRVVVW
jgi:hypothetical protein